VIPNASEIKVFKKWPTINQKVPQNAALAEGNPVGAEARESKVPSKISYSETVNGQEQWGHSIDSKSKVLLWTKLELMPLSAVNQLEALRHLFEGMSALKDSFCEGDNVDLEIQKRLVRSPGKIIEDFLYQIATTWHQHMEKFSGGALSNVDLDIVVTLPTVGELNQKDQPSILQFV
jgi:hypothetical protein